MVYKNFRLNCIVRILALVAVTALLSWLVVNTEMYATMIIIGLVVVFQTWNLLYYVQKSNRDLSRFLTAITHSDFSSSFADNGQGGSHRELRDVFEEVLSNFRSTRAEKEEHFRYLQTVVMHISIGLLAFDSNGKIDFMNMATRRLLGIPRIKSIEDIARVSRDMVDSLYNIKSGQKLLARVERDGELLQLSLAATEIRLGKRMIKLVSLQNIASELAEREMKAWQQLVRVLTHEIMNSVTPIASLASTARGLLTSSANGDRVEHQPSTLNDEIIGDLGSAVDTIEKRSEGLIRFVQSYRKLSRIPKPDFQNVPLSELFERVIRLTGSCEEARDIKFSFRVDPEKLELTADPDLLEQVMLNLLKNAVQSLASQNGGEIDILGRLSERGSITIAVTDNGSGIQPEALESVFIPFFTTKPEGSGLGLSLSRQIIRLHGGEINATSTPSQKTVFTMRF
jgi:nitrogen fixation/metabolism regulation signal transduction histidine kinase